LKLGAEVCIRDTSENFCVWDADLIHARALAAGKGHRVFFPTEFCVELLKDQFMTAIYNDLSGGTLRWSKESNLGKIAFASAAMLKLWSNFYNNVLLPAGEQKKLRMRPARTLLKKYLTALDGHSFTELAKLNGVTVTGTNDGKIWDDLSGATLTWRYANKSVIGTGMPCHSKEWSHGSRVVSWEQ